MTLSRPLRINWLIVGIDAFQHVAAAGETPATARKNPYLSRRPTRFPAEKARHHTDEDLTVKRSEATIWLRGGLRAFLRICLPRPPPRKPAPPANPRRGKLLPSTTRTARRPRRSR